MKIYKKDSKGKIRVLNLYTEGADLVQVSGLLDGKMVENRTTCKGKNIGKSNETTPSEQALSELDSKIKKKLREGYFETIEEAKTKEVLLPMLAKDYGKEKNKIVWKTTDSTDSFGVYAQPKLDGMRCFAVCKDGQVTLLSRDNVVIETMSHISTEIRMKLYQEGLILDGELYVHGENFQTNMKYIKKYTKGLSEKIGFHIYDVPSFKGPYATRKMYLEGIAKDKSYEYLGFVFTQKLTDENHLTEMHGRFLEDGFEGTMVRHSNEEYKFNGRSSQLLKYKDFKDITCKIVHIGPANRRPKWGRPVVEWTTPSGETVKFACGTKMTHKQREELLTNAKDYIGKTAEVRYFEEYETGVPRFPVMVGIRLDK